MSDLLPPPVHIALIMDGNGRWAKRRLLTRAAGHRAGAQNMRKLAEEAEKMGIQIMTFWALSTENWSRSAEEIADLMGLMREYIQQYIDDRDRNNMRIQFIGERSRLDADLRERMALLENLTRNKTGLRVVLAVNYGGRDDITRATRKVAEQAAAGRLKPEELDEPRFASLLDTAELPDPDLLIRTSGELRLSNFLLWQCAYSEFYVTDTLWPDFSKKELQAAIEQFRKRDRRFGGRKPEKERMGR